MLLGHSELRITADFYSHLLKQTAAKAAQRLDAVLSATKSRGVSWGVNATLGGGCYAAARACTAVRSALGRR